MKKHFLIILIKILTCTVWAQVAANDHFSDAIPLGTISAAFTLSGSFQGAALEPDETSIPGATVSVWYTFIPAKSGYLMTVSTMTNGPVRTWIYKMSGNTVADLELLGSPESGTPKLTQGERYALQLTSSPPETNGFEINFQFAEPVNWSAPPTRPFNDDLASAVDLSKYTENTVIGHTDRGTREAGEPYSPFGTASVWYKWTPRFPGRLSVTMQSGSAHFSLYASEDNLVTHLQELAPEEGSFRVSLGKTYYIGVYNEPDSLNSFTFYYKQIEKDSPANTPPPNDNLSTAILVSGPNFSITGTNLSATREINEPLAAPDASGASVWYRWVAPYEARGWAIYRAPGGDLRIAYYRGGPTFADLRRFGADSILDFKAGEEIYIQVDTPVSRPAEWFQIDLSLHPFDEPNDNFADAAEPELWGGTSILPTPSSVTRHGNRVNRSMFRFLISPFGGNSRRSGRAPCKS